MAKALMINQNIKSIDLHSNSLNDEAGCEIIKAIINNPKILKMNLNKNLISYKLQLEITKFLK